MRRLLLTSAATLLLGVALGQQETSALRGNDPQHRQLPQADPKDAFPEGPNMKCWDYKIPGEPGAELTADDIFDSKDTTFPADFLWGTGTAAYQVEGAYNVDGRGPSMWDTFVKIPGKIANGDTGDVACDHYHRYKEDVKLMKDLGLKSYRYSISWSRVLPEGTGKVNPKGIEFYQNLTNELLANGIEPAVTLYHWDLPDTLSQKGGWMNADTAVAFGEFADIMFEALGDKVKLWFTLNEPWTTSIAGYGNGGQAPGLKDMAKGPYISGHNQLLAHAAAAKIYKQKYQAAQGGKIGAVLSTEWKEPLCRESVPDQEAAERSLVWYLAWFADPIFKGDYPAEMKARVGDRLPEFTEAQKADLKGSADFFAINNYATNLIQGPTEKIDPDNYFSDLNGWIMMDPKWAKGDASWLSIVPWGLRRLLRWVKERYDDPIVYVTENGVSIPGESKMSLKDALDDQERVTYLKDYLSEVWKAMKYDNVKVAGYFHWSLLDNFEWSDGYKVRFGLVHVDYKNQKRTPKESAKVRMWEEEKGETLPTFLPSFLHALTHPPTHPPPPTGLQQPHPEVRRWRQRGPCCCCSWARCPCGHAGQGG